MYDPDSSNYYVTRKQNHTQLTMYYIRPFLYIINVSLQFSQCHEARTKCIGYNTNCIGAVMMSNQMGTNTVYIVTIHCVK